MSKDTFLLKIAMKEIKLAMDRIMGAMTVAVTLVYMHSGSPTSSGELI